MERHAFAERVRQIDARIREIDQTTAGDLTLDAAADTATWERKNYRATLVLHSGGGPSRLALSLHTGSTRHPDSETIGIDDADVVEMVARPIAKLLSGEVTE